MSTVITVVLVALGTFVLGAARALLADEVRAWLPHIAHRLVQATARRLPPGAAERYEEEWHADLRALSDRPLSALLMAAHIRCNTRQMIQSLDRSEGQTTAERQVVPVISDLDVCMRVSAMCACTQLRRATRGITQLYEAEMAPGGLKVTQLPILVALRSDGDLPVTRLAGTLSLDRTTLTRNLGVLEQRGLIRTTEHEDSTGVRIVSLTHEGALLLARVLISWQEVQDVVEERFGGQRLRALYDELAALSAAVVRRDDA